MVRCKTVDPERQMEDKRKTGLLALGNCVLGNRLVMLKKGLLMESPFVQEVIPHFVSRSKNVAQSKQAG